MAFNPDIKRKIVRDKKTDEHLPCLMCGARYPLPDAVYLMLCMSSMKKEWKRRVGCDRQANGIPLCPNCHRVFDEVLRPYLYKALRDFGTTGLPDCWKKNNKILSVTEQDIELENS
jgi:hypothetical protein